MDEPWSTRVAGLVADALALLSDAPPETRAPLEASARRLNSYGWRILVSGLCSVGKSSFVSALWGDSELLPTAVRDCTQSNTIIRQPSEGEGDREIRVAHLPRERAIQLALRGTQFHRLSGLLEEEDRLRFVQLEELSAEERLRETVAEVRRLFRERAALLVLHEPLTDELDQLDQFMTFLDSPGYHPDAVGPGRWDERREILMGARRPDGRLVDTGHMLAFRHVEMLRRTERWPAPAPELIDTPWVPAFHNARRAELILEQARTADLLVVLSLPQAFHPEEWMLKVFRERPGLLKRTLVVFNQIDTVDPAALFSRDGFSGIHEANRERLIKLGLDPANILMSCARLPFLRGAPQDDFVASRTARLREVLARLRKVALSRSSNELIQTLLAACDPEDGGLETLRRRMLALKEGAVLRQQGIDAIDALERLDSGIPNTQRESWQSLMIRATGLRMSAGR